MHVIILLFVLGSFPGFAQSWANHHVTAACRIFSITGQKIRAFPGSFCVFLDDGSFLSADEKGLRRIAIDSSKVWELAGNYYHKLSMSFDQTRILALSSSLLRENKRQDKLQVISLDGKVLAERNVSDLFASPAENDIDHVIKNVSIGGKDVWMEFSHFNSFHEIPPQTNSMKGPAWLKPGNYIINGLKQGFLVLSPNLEKVLHHRVIESSILHSVHDVQVTKRGTLLFYNNIVNTGDLGEGYFGGSKPAVRHSGIYEVDLEKHTVIRKFESNPRELFFAWRSGGVQELDDSTWIFKHFLNGVYIYDHRKKIILNSFASVNVGNGAHFPIQEVKVSDLSRFLAHWK